MFNQFNFYCVLWDWDASSERLFCGLLPKRSNEICDRISVVLYWKPADCLLTTTCDIRLGDDDSSQKNVWDHKQEVEILRLNFDFLSRVHFFLNFFTCLEANRQQKQAI